MGRDNISENYEYIAQLYCKENVLQQKITNDVRLTGKVKMQLSPVEGKLISMLLQMINATKVIEIGTLGGYSATWIADALPQDGILYALEKSPENLQLAQANLNHDNYSKKIKFIEGNAIESLEGFLDNASFDAVFIDADKVSYPLYLKHAKRLLRKGGLLIADNTFLFGLVVSSEPPEHNPHLWEAMREFNKSLASDNDFNSLMIPTNEGLTIAIRL